MCNHYVDLWHILQTFFSSFWDLVGIEEYSLEKYKWMNERNSTMRLFVWWDGERCWYILDWLYCILRYSRSAYAFRSKMVGVAAHHLKWNIKVMSCMKYCTSQFYMTITYDYNLSKFFDTYLTSTLIRRSNESCLGQPQFPLRLHFLMANGRYSDRL